jgi:hypothetical protein
VAVPAAGRGSGEHVTAVTGIVAQRMFTSSARGIAYDSEAWPHLPVRHLLTISTESLE